jgi:hypothetical protein
MKRLLLSATALAAAISGGAHASILSISAFGGFVEGSAGPYTPGPGLPLPEGAPVGSPEGFPEADADPPDSGTDGTLVNYFGCVDGLCTSFAWGTPSDGGGPFGGKSGASINVLDGTNPDGTFDGTGDPVGIPAGEEGSRVDAAPSFNTVVHHPNPLGVALPIGSLTHFNEPINGDPAPGPDGDNGFVGAVEVDYRIAIDKYEDDGTTLIGSRTLDLIFDVVFFETLNDEPCPTDNERGSVCDDTFQFFGDTVTKFSIAGQKYTIELLGFCLDGETAADCRAAVEPNGTRILYSAEGGTSVGIVLEIKEAPVPGVLALISAGLIGLGFARRRQAKA